MVDDQPKPSEDDPTLFVPTTNGQELAVIRAEALRRTVSHLLPHLHGAFLVGTSVSSYDDVWSSYQLTDSDADCLMLAATLPSSMAQWTRALLLGHLSTDTITTTSTRGEPKAPVELARALRASVTELNEFFERWLLVGHFVTEFDCTEPIVYAHRPMAEDLVDYVRPALFAVNHACNTFLEKFGLKSTISIMELAQRQVDFMVLYPEPNPEAATDLLTRLMGDGVPLDPLGAYTQARWMPGFAHEDQEPEE
jgi:hypothetical protein